MKGIGGAVGGAAGDLSLLFEYNGWRRCQRIASQLYQYSKPTGKDGSKRHCTSMQSKGNLEDNIRPLQPMFWCLETALKA